MTVQTLPLDESRGSQPAAVDHLYVVLAGGRPAAARWALDDVTRIEVGRGPELAARRDGTTLNVAITDPWLSSSHFVFERERAHWIAVDAGSRNGIRINGSKQARSIILRDDVLEAGRSLLILREAELAGAPSVVLAARVGELATLDPELARDFDELRRIAPSSVPVLIGGPTGVGKERVARAVHTGSGRSGAFVPVNCGALPAGLVESELFGHRRGAFSGAIADHPGLVASSSSGTLFLDEIGDLPMSAQAALLRVLEEHEVRAVGATSATAVDLRVVAATHRDLDDMVADGRFREDLLARLAGFDLELPGLVDRRVDLGLMLAEIIPDGIVLDAAAARAVFAYAWPRNIRELVHAIERATALAGAGEIGLAHLPEEVAHAKWSTPPTLATDARRDELVALLEKHRGNVSKVAGEMGRVRQQVQRWLKRYGVDPSRYR